VYSHLLKPKYGLPPKSELRRQKQHRRTKCKAYIKVGWLRHPAQTVMYNLRSATTALLYSSLLLGRIAIAVDQSEWVSFWTGYPQCTLNTCLVPNSLASLCINETTTACTCYTTNQCVCTNTTFVDTVAQCVACECPDDASNVFDIYNGACLTHGGYVLGAGESEYTSCQSNTATTVTAVSSTSSAHAGPITSLPPISSSTTSPSPVNSSSGISGGAIGGIVGGVLGGLLLIVVGAVLFWRKRRRDRWASFQPSTDQNIVKPEEKGEQPIVEGEPLGARLQNTETQNAELGSQERPLGARLSTQ
jgi:hypothetical protein